MVSSNGATTVTVVRGSANQMFVLLHKIGRAAHPERAAVSPE